METPTPALPTAPWGKPWFHQKTFGYGAGLPCSREGWITLGAYTAANLALWVVWALMLGRDPALAGVTLFVGITLTTIPLVVVAWGRTAGGWRWRNGGSDRG